MNGYFYVKICKTRCTVEAPTASQSPRHCEQDTVRLIPALFPRSPHRPVSSANEAGVLWLQHCAPPSPPPGKGPPQHPTKHTSLSQAQVGAPHRHWSRVHGVTPSCTFLPEPHSLIQKCHNQAQETASAGNLNAEPCVACFSGLTAFEYTMVHFFLRAERVGEKSATQTS